MRFTHSTCGRGLRIIRTVSCGRRVTGGQDAHLYVRQDA